jgi:hypothetical protein
VDCVGYGEAEPKPCAVPSLLGATTAGTDFVTGIADGEATSGADEDCMTALLEVTGSGTYDKLEGIATDTVGTDTGPYKFEPLGTPYVGASAWLEVFTGAGVCTEPLELIPLLWEAAAQSASLVFVTKTVVVFIPASEDGGGG